MEYISTKILICCAIIIALLLIRYLKWVAFVPVAILLRYTESRKNASRKRDDGSIGMTDTQRIERPTRRIRTAAIRYLYGYLRYMDFQVGLIPSHHIRKFVYRHLFGVRLAERTIIYWGAEIRSHSKLVIGKGSIIGDRAILDARNGIEIGRNVNFSSDVHIWTEQHDHKDPLFSCNSTLDFKVTIGDRVWIGPSVTVLHSVTIGEGAVIAAGAVLTKNVPAFEIWGGIPAKKIGERNRNLRYELDGIPTPFY